MKLRCKRMLLLKTSLNVWRSVYFVSLVVNKHILFLLYTQLLLVEQVTELYGHPVYNLFEFILLVYFCLFVYLYAKRCNQQHFCTTTSKNKTRLRWMSAVVASCTSAGASTITYANVRPSLTLLSTHIYTLSQSIRRSCKFAHIHICGTRGPPCYVFSASRTYICKCLFGRRWGKPC